MKLWELATGKEMTTIPNAQNGRYKAVCFSPDGETLAYSRANYLVELWDIKNKKVKTK